MAKNSRSSASTADGATSRVMDRIQRAWGESPFYQAQLDGPAPDRFAHMPFDPRTPDKALAEFLLRGKLTIGSQTIDCEGELDILWSRLETIGTQTRLGDFMHEFQWLRHASALGEKAKEPARELLGAWLDRYEKWSPTVWAPYATAERIAELCCHGGIVLRGGDAMWRSRVLNAMARQIRHLAKAAHRAPTGYQRLMTAMGLCLGGFCLPACAAAADRGIELLRRELRLQIRPDGGHLSRNPSLQLNLLVRLQMILKAIEASGAQAPGFLKHVEARAASFLHLFRCADGRLAVFNGGYEDDGRAVLAALQGVDGAAAPTGFARHSGFQRLEAGRTMLIADTGLVAPASNERLARLEMAYDGVGAFQLSSGKQRLIVNCGNGARLSPDWAAALTAPAAHSALCFDEVDNRDALFSSALARHRRGENDDGQLLEIGRGESGPAGRQGSGGGLRHSRRLFLSALGDSVRGQDVIGIGGSVRQARGFALRFHLHPSVKASLARDKRSVLVAGLAGEGWRFRSNCKDIRLDKSVYLGGGGAAAATEQIVLHLGGLDRRGSEDIVAKWAFQRVD